MSTLKVNTLQDASGNNASTTAEIEQGRAKAWLKYEQIADSISGNVGSTGISDSFNIDSVTDAADGVTAVYFDTDFANTHYAVVGLCAPSANNDHNSIIHHNRNGGNVGTREAVQMTTGIGITTIRVSDQTKQDTHFFIAAFGDQ